MSFQYELTIFCDSCGAYLEPSATMRRRGLPSEKSIVDAQTDWKFVKDKELGYRAYCPKCQERMKRSNDNDNRRFL